MSLIKSRVLRILDFIKRTLRILDFIKEGLLIIDYIINDFKDKIIINLYNY